METDDVIDYLNPYTLGNDFETRLASSFVSSAVSEHLPLSLQALLVRKTHFKSIDGNHFLICGTLSMQRRFQRPGRRRNRNSGYRYTWQNPSPYVLTFVVFMLCCVLTNFMSNTATTALLVPICVSIATEIGADPSAVLMACVIGGSCAYATPIGMPANTMVITAGGYTFKDYAKAGIPLYSSGDHCKYGLTADFLSVLPIRTDGDGKQ